MFIISRMFLLLYVRIIHTFYIHFEEKSVILHPKMLNGSNSNDYGPIYQFSN